MELLEKQGWTVWWDREVEPGRSFGDEIDKQVSEAACVVVFWSRHSIDSNWVRAEANEGLDRGVLIPLLLDDVRVPLVFRHTETVSLLGWPDHEKREELGRALQGIASTIGRQPGELSLKHRRPGRVRLAAISAGIVTVLVIVAAIYYEVLSGRSIPDEGAARRPVASIAVMPFSNVEMDIAPEVSRLLGATGSFFIEGQDQIAAYLKNPTLVQLDAKYTLQGTGSASGLTVSLFNREKRETLWTRTIKTQGVPISQVVQSIATEVAGVFNRPAIDVDDVSQDIYVTFLQARANLRSDLGAKGDKEAIDLFLKVIDRAPRFAEAYAGLCQIYTSMYNKTQDINYFEQAEKRCFRAAALSDDNVYVDTALGELYRTSGRLSASVERLESARQKAPFSTEAIRQLALVKHRLKLDDEAVALLQYAQELEPNYWKNYDALASIYFGTGRFSDAAREYEIERNLVTDKTRALNNLGSAYYMAGDFKKAIAVWLTSLNSGTTPQALSNLGSAYFFNHDFEKAAATYRKALDMQPDDPRLWGNAGDAFMQTHEDARPYFQKTLELTLAQLQINPDNGESLSLAASSYAAVGNENESRRYIAKALKAAPGDVYTLYYVAVAYARLGDTAQKQETLDRMVVMGYSRQLIKLDANFNERRAK